MNIKNIIDEERILSERLEKIKSLKHRHNKACDLRRFAVELEKSKAIAFGQYSQGEWPMLGIMPGNERRAAIGGCTPTIMADDDLPALLEVMVEAACHYIRQQADKIAKEVEEACK
jgi:hypothetical protein